jgi:hypothetical protein
MFALAVRRAAPRVASNQQKRGFVDYLVNYPDKVRWFYGLCNVVRDFWELRIGDPLRRWLNMNLPNKSYATADREMALIEGSSRIFVSVILCLW